MGKGEAQEKLGENTSLAKLVEEDEEGRAHQEVLLDEEQEVPLDGLVPLLQLWTGCRHCFQSRSKKSPHLHAEEPRVAAPWAKAGSWRCHHLSLRMDPPI